MNTHIWHKKVISFSFIRQGPEKTQKLIKSRVYVYSGVGGVGVKCDFRKPLTLLCSSFVLYIETSTTMHHCIVSAIQKTKPYIHIFHVIKVNTNPRKSTSMTFLF